MLDVSRSAAVIITPRVYPAVGALSDTKFVVFGGLYQRKSSSDIFTVDLKRKAVTKVAVRHDSLSFHCKSFVKTNE